MVLENGIITSTYLIQILLPKRPLTMSKHPSLHRQQFEDWVETPGYTYLEEYQPTTQQLQQHAASVAANNQAETKEQEREEDSSELAEEQPHEMISSSESSYALSSSSPSENPRSSTYGKYERRCG